jgi:AcrR family transcriptional regulator
MSYQSERVDGEVYPELGNPKALSRPVTRRSRGFTSEERWEQILQVAGDLFSRRGYLGSSLEDIASRIGIQKASLYHYISSKEDILFALELRGHELGRSIIQKLDDAKKDGFGGGTASERLAEFIRSWVEGIGMEGANYGSLGPHVLRNLSMERRNELLVIRRQMRDWVIAILKDGMVEGVFDPSLDPRIASSALFSLLNNTTWWYGSSGGWEEIASEYVMFLLHGLQPSLVDGSTTLSEGSSSGSPVTSQ